MPSSTERLLVRLNDSILEADDWLNVALRLMPTMFLSPGCADRETEAHSVSMATILCRENAITIVKMCNLAKYVSSANRINDITNEALAKALYLLQPA